MDLRLSVGSPSEDESRTPRSSPTARSPMRCVRLLLGCTSATELLGTVLAEGPGWITGEGSALYLLDSAGMLRLTASHGLPDWAHERYSTVDPASDLPAAMALRLRRPYLLSPEHTSVDYPNKNVGMGTGMVAVIALPMVVDERPVGVLALALAHRGTVPRRDLDVLETIGEACAHRLSHLLDHADARIPQDPAGAPPDGAGSLPAGLAHPMLSLAVRAAGHGAFERDLVTGESYWDAAAFRVTGQPATADGSAPELDRIVHPEDLPDVQAALAESLTTGGWYRIGYRVLRGGGKVARIEETGEVMLDVHGRPVRVAGLLSDRDQGRAQGQDRDQRREHPREQAEEQATPGGARTALLLALTRSLSRAVTVRDVTTAVTDVARPAFGAASIVLDLVDEGRLLPVSHTVYGGPRRTELTRLADLSENVMQHALTRSAPLFSEPDAGRGRTARSPRPPGRYCRWSPPGGRWAPA